MLALELCNSSKRRGCFHDNPTDAINRVLESKSTRVAEGAYQQLLVAGTLTHVLDVCIRLHDALFLALRSSAQLSAVQCAAKGSIAFSSSSSVIAKVRSCLHRTLWP